MKKDLLHYVGRLALGLPQTAVCGKFTYNRTNRPNVVDCPDCRTVVTERLDADRG
jgi:hypothetical protein